MGSDLRDLIAGLDPASSVIDARDAALLVLGWAAALRRSELAGLDWRELGSGTGFVQIVDRGFVVTLPTSIGMMPRGGRPRSRCNASDRCSPFSPYLLALCLAASA